MRTPAERRLESAKEILGELLVVIEAGERDGVSICDFFAPLDQRWHVAVARARLFLGRPAPAKAEVHRG